MASTSRFSHGNEVRTNARGWVPVRSCDCEYRLFIGSLKAGVVTERSELGSCRAFRFQYPILIGECECVHDAH